MRFAALIFFLAISTTQSVFGAAQDENDLQHDWQEERGNGEIRFISNYRSPIPFSTTGEPEATLTMSAVEISPAASSLSETMKSEVQQIRKELQIADYLEKDGKKPDRGIASYFEEINGQKVGFIKYRTLGVIGKQAGMPRSVRHAIFIKEDKMYFVQLVVLFAKHQEEVREDQIRVIKSLIGR